MKKRVFMAKRFQPIVFASLLLLVLFAPCGAQNLVTNPGFETDDFTGWTQGGNTGSTYVGTSPNLPYDGSYAAQLGPVGSDGTLSQTIATNIGDTYQVSWFFIHADGAGPINDFTATFAGQTLFSQSNTNLPTNWTNYTYDVTATNTSSTLLFSFRQDPSYQGLDDVSVVDVSSTSVPEPATMLLLGFGLVGVAGFRKKFKK